MKSFYNCVLIILIILFVSFTSANIFLGFCYIIDNNKELFEEPKTEIKLEQPEFFLYDEPNDSLVLLACNYYGLKEPYIVLSQAILETGGYKSYQCKVNNNLFGLFNSRKMEYFKFNHWTESVEAYKNKIQYRLKENENYYHFLKRIGYAEDSAYIEKVKFIRNNLTYSHH
jgi:flagellum-specific peptidoglycan hydrolase FlgJ